MLWCVCGDFWICGGIDFRSQESMDYGNWDGRRKVKEDRKTPPRENLKSGDLLESDCNCLRCLLFVV